MYQFYLIKNLNKKIAVKNKNEIVTKMRRIEWNGRSNNSDYMHVFAIRNENKHFSLKYQNEEEFIHDIITHGIIVQVDIITYLSYKLKEKLILNFF